MRPITCEEVNINEAEMMAVEENVTCKTCTAPLTENDDRKGDGYCWHCREYWNDCRNGLWD